MNKLRPIVKECINQIQSEIDSVDSDNLSTSIIKEEVTHSEGTVSVMAGGITYKAPAFFNESGRLIGIDTPAEFMNVSNPVFKAVEKYFDDWIEGMQGTETHDMYFGSFEEMGGGSYLSKRGAIESGVEAVMEYMVDNNIKFMALTDENLAKVDLEGVFQA